MTQVDPRLDDALEDARMRSVEHLQLLDSPPEERFSQITRMARAVFGVPMASLSLLARDRQWFKAIDGLQLQNIPRPQTVCQTTVARAYARPDDPMLVVEDLREVPEFAELPAVAAEGEFGSTPASRSTVLAGTRWEPSVSTTPNRVNSASISAPLFESWRTGRSAK